MKRIVLAQATLITLLAAGLLFQGQQVRHYQQAIDQTAQHTINMLSDETVKALYYEKDMGCYEDEIGIWTQDRTECVPIDEIMTDAEYNSIIERVDRVQHGLSASFHAQR